MRGGGKADNATNPTNSIELSLTVVPRSSRSRETIRLSPSLSLSSLPRVETGSSPDVSTPLRGVESGEGEGACIATDIGRGDRKGMGREREREEKDATRSERRKVYETFSLNLCSRDACFCGGTGRRDAGRERGTRAPGAAGRWPVIAMRYGGHFSLK